SLEPSGGLWLTRAPGALPKGAPTMRSKHDRRNHLAKRQRSKPHPRSGAKTKKSRVLRRGPVNVPHFKRPETARQYAAMSEANQETWDSVAHVVSRMRDRVSLSKASKEFGIAPGTVMQLGRPALRRKNGRYVATRTDRLLRVVSILKRKGKQEIATRDSR